MINIVICEDEKKIQDILEQYLIDILKYKDIKYRIKKFNSGLELLNNFSEDMDVLLLDIHMDGINGMETAKRIRGFNHTISIIFITSLVCYIQKGYEVGAYRYLLKPLEKKELQKHILPCIDHIMKNKLNFLIIQNEKKETFKINLYDILYIEVQNKELTIHTKIINYKIKMTLGKINEKLKDPNFIKCHKSYIINLSYVQNVKNRIATLDNGDEIPIGRYKYNEVKSKFLSFLGDSIC